jgi:hypothetical protein
VSGTDGEGRDGCPGDSHDHRIIDGHEAVSFLGRVKECIEAPERMLLDA